MPFGRHRWEIHKAVETPTVKRLRLDAKLDPHDDLLALGADNNLGGISAIDGWPGSCIGRTENKMKPRNSGSIVL